MSNIIREARPADIPAIAVLFDLYRQFYEQAPDLAGAEQFIRARQTRQESVILVAEAETGVGPGGARGLSGFCQLYPSFCSVEAQPIYTLYDLFVHPEARRTGLGRQLLQAAAARAAQDGKVRMDLTTARTNTRAQALYAAEGWVLDEVFLAYNQRVPGRG